MGIMATGPTRAARAKHRFDGAEIRAAGYCIYHITDEIFVKVGGGGMKGRVVIIGAGIVGCSLADELTARGCTDVVVLEQGPLFATGGSTSHAPGGMHQLNLVQVMTRFAQYSVQRYRQLDLDGEPCFYPVGSLEVAGT